jgi:hypothetical protein
MNAIERLRAGFENGEKDLRAISASGQLGYGVPETAFLEGLKRRPHFIGADMGSTDPGPYYLGEGELATSDEMTRRDLRQLLVGARGLDVPLLIGSAGTGGAAPHLERVLDVVRSIARDDGLHFRLAWIHSDMPRDLVKQAVRAGRVQPLGAIAPLSEAEVDASSQLVGLMGTEAYARALEAGADVVIAGRSCDTAIYASIPEMLGFPMGPAMHMAKIIECASLCCLPGGRDSILGVLEGDSFVLESMNPNRHATPMSVAAHSLYEQADPLTVIEPEGMLSVADARYEAVDGHRSRISGATWEPTDRPSVKIEGAALIGERVIMIGGSSDPRFIANIDRILEDIPGIVADLVGRSGTEDYQLSFRVYGIDGVVDWPTPSPHAPREIFVLAECIAPTLERAKTVAKTTKQYLLHHGFPGRLSTAGNLAFPFTPPELVAGRAYRFNVNHVMEVDDLASLFPVEVEDI